MKNRILVPLCLAAASLVQGEEPFLDPHLEPLRGFLGRTWRSEFPNSTPENPVIDVSRWERALNGRAVRAIHSINGGDYGGESFIFWDAARGSLVYYYFTTAGFYTTGTMRIEDNRVHSHEVVTGSAGGVTEVRAVTEVRPDGTLAVASDYLQEGQWVPGRRAIYREDPSAQVVFR